MVKTHNPVFGMVVELSLATDKYFYLSKQKIADKMYFVSLRNSNFFAQTLQACTASHTHPRDLILKRIMFSLPAVICPRKSRRFTISKYAAFWHLYAEPLPKRRPNLEIWIVKNLRFFVITFSNRLACCGRGNSAKPSAASSVQYKIEFSRLRRNFRPFHDYQSAVPQTGRWWRSQKVPIIKT